MKLVKTMIEKKMDNATKLEKNSELSLTYQERIFVYQLSLAFLGMKDKIIRRKIQLLNKYFETFDQKTLLKLLNYKPQEDSIILKAIKELEILKEKQIEGGSHLFNDYTWAILSYEHEEAE